MISLIIKFEIDEPWDDYKIITASIIQLFTKSDKSYLLIKDTLSAKKFIVTNRYKEDNISELISGKKIIVAIASLNEVGLSDNDSEIIPNLTFSGIGSIELASL